MLPKEKKFNAGSRLMKGQSRIDLITSMQGRRYSYLSFVVYVVGAPSTASVPSEAE